MGHAPAGAARRNGLTMATDRLLSAIGIAFSASGQSRVALAAELDLADGTVGRILRMTDDRPPRDLAYLRTLATELGLGLNVSAGRPPADPTGAVIGDLRKAFVRSGKRFVDLHDATGLQYRTLTRFLSPDEPPTRNHELDAVLRLAAALWIRVRLDASCRHR